MAGGIEFNPRKFDELVVYIARRLPPEAALGRVKLAKLLMLIDHTAYERLGRSITGATYQKWEHGHLPTQLVTAEKDLIANERIDQETVDYFGKSLRYTTARDDPHMEDFSEDELAIVEGVLKRYGHESASYLSWLSHQTLGWQLADEKEEIPYDAIFLGKPTERDLVHASAVAAEHGWV